MTDVLVLDHDQTLAALEPATLLENVRRALIATSTGDVSLPPRIAAFAPAGLLGAMPGYAAGLGLAGKLVSVFPNVTPDGRGAHQGLVALFDDVTGQLLALMDGSAVTARRTAASATVAYQALGPPGADRIAVLGAGTQGQAQLEYLRYLDVSATIVVAAQSTTSAADVAARFGVRPAGSVRQAVHAADVVFCCTDAVEPVVNDTWLHADAHVSSVGGSRGRELPAATVTSGALFVEWPGAISQPPPAGAAELYDVPDEHATLIGAVLTATLPGRVGPGRAVFKSTGVAALDVAAARTAYDVASRSGLGTHLALSPHHASHIRELPERS